MHCYVDGILCVCVCVCVVVVVVGGEHKYALCMHSVCVILCSGREGRA